MAQGCALARSLLLARLLGPEQLGLAVTLILTSQFFESVTESGSDRFLIQDPSGDHPEVQRLAQLFGLGRGVLIALALVCLSQPLAAFYRQPVLVHGMIGLALAPAILGFLNLDMRRVQRHHDFSREAIVVAMAEIVSLLVTAAAAFITRDFTGAIYGLVARAVVMTVVSNMVADRRWAAGWSARYSRDLTRFALPLALNGLLLFLATQGDRLLIGHNLGVAELGRYSAVLLLIYYPSQSLSRYLQVLNLPLVAAGRTRHGGIAQAAESVAGEANVLAIGMVVGFAAVAPLAIPILYGSRFTTPCLVIALIGVLQASRFIRLWPTTVALGIGRSGIVLTNNIVRLIAYPAGIAGVVLIGGIDGLLQGFVAGEIAAMVAAILLLNRALDRSMAADGMRLLLFLSAAIASVVAARAIDRHDPGTAVLTASLVVVIGALAGWRDRQTLGKLWLVLQRRAKGQGVGRA